MKIRKYRNGNVTLKAEPEDYDRESMLVHALWALGDHDFSLFGEEYCLGNVLGMAVDCYDAYNDRLLRVPYADIEDLTAGKTIRLYSRPLTAYDRQTYHELATLGEL